MTKDTPDSAWMLTELMAAVPGAVAAVVFSDDGMLQIRSEGLGQDEAERLAAGCSAMWSLGAQHTEQIGRTRTLTLEAAAGFLFLRAAGTGSALAVRTTTEVDARILYQQADLLVKRLGGRVLTAPARTVPETER